MFDGVCNELVFINVIIKTLLLTIVKRATSISQMTKISTLCEGASERISRNKYPHCVTNRLDIFEYLIHCSMIPLENVCYSLQLRYRTSNLHMTESQVCFRYNCPPVVYGCILSWNFITAWQCHRSSESAIPFIPFSISSLIVVKPFCSCNINKSNPSMILPCDHLAS